MQSAKIRVKRSERGVSWALIKRAAAAVTLSVGVFFCSALPKYAQQKGKQKNRDLFSRITLRIAKFHLESLPIASRARERTCERVDPAVDATKRCKFYLRIFEYYIIIRVRAMSVCRGIVRVKVKFEPVRLLTNAERARGSLQINRIFRGRRAENGTRRREATHTHTHPYIRRAEETGAQGGSVNTRNTLLPVVPFSLRYCGPVREKCAP